MPPRSGAASALRFGAQVPNPARVQHLLQTLLRVAGTSEEDFLKIVTRMQAVWRGTLTRKRMRPLLTKKLTVTAKQAIHDQQLDARWQGAADEAGKVMEKVKGQGQVGFLQKATFNDGAFEFQGSLTNPFMPWSIKRKQDQKGKASSGETKAPIFKDRNAHVAISNEKRALEDEIGKLAGSLEKKDRSQVPLSARQRSVVKTPREQSLLEMRKDKRDELLEQLSQDVAAMESSEEFFTRGVETEELPEVDLSSSIALNKLKAPKTLLSKEGFNLENKPAIPWTTMRRPPADGSDSERTKQLKEVVKILSSKAHFKFRNVRDAFRLVDVDKSGLVNRQEMQVFLRQFNLPIQYADLLFDAIDVDNNGYVDYVEFMEHFGPVIQPGCQPFHTYRSPLSRAGQRMFEPNVVGWSLRKLG